MKRHGSICGLLPAIALLGLGCNAPPVSGPVETVHVYAAASTRDAVEEIARDYQAQFHVPVDVTAEASSTLAKQIEQGADADLFLSADEDWADYLADRKLVEQRHDLLGNRLAVITPADSALRPTKLADLAAPGVKLLALAGPSVPAGRYARQALEKEGVLDSVKDRIIEAGNVRAALTFVVKGEADAGVVYVSDAAAAGDKVRTAFIIPEDLHKPIRYVLALLKRDSIKPSARQFDEFLRGEAAASVFRKADFQVLP
jgi:molybdate transport system substrate-binding protein